MTTLPPTKEYISQKELLDDSNIMSKIDAKATV